jgi:hypothetical protein
MVEAALYNSSAERLLVQNLMSFLPPELLLLNYTRPNARRSLGVKFFPGVAPGSNANKGPPLEATPQAIFASN